MIEIKNLSFKYNNDKQIFNQSSCSFPNKGLFLITGENGVGKTTLFKLMQADLNIESGEIIIDDLVINNSISTETKDKLTKKITYISQKNDLINFLNCIENVNINNIIHSDSKQSKLCLLDHNTFSNRKIDSLSNGEKSIISVEKSLVENKDIFLLDEITDYLDDYNTNLITKSIEKIAQSKLVLIITHDERIINKYENIIIIKNCKIQSNFKSTISNEIIIQKDIEKQNRKKSIKYISKKIFFNNINFFSFFGIVLILLNTLFITVGSLVTYPFNHNYYKTINTGCYGVYCTNEDLIINDTNISNTIRPSATINKDNLNIIEENFDIAYYDSIGKFKITNNDVYQNKVYLTKEEFEKQKKASNIINEFIMLNLYNLNSKAIIQYEINNSLPYGLSMLINENDLSKLKFIEPISIKCALWENDIIPFNDKDYFTSKTTLNFINYNIFEFKYGFKLERSINDNEIFISNNLSQYASKDKINFYNFSNIDLNNYYNEFIDLNNVFNENLNIIIDDKISNKLSDGEVLVNNATFEKILKLIEFKCNPYIEVNENNINEFKKFCKNKKYKVIEPIKLNKEYSIHGLEIFKRDLYSNLFFYYSLLIMNIIMEICILSLAIKSYLIKYNSDISILKRYFTEKETYVIFINLLLLTTIFSILIAIILSSILLNLIQNKYTVPFININVTFLIIILLIVLLTSAYTIIFKIHKKTI